MDRKILTEEIKSLGYKVVMTRGGQYSCLKCCFRSNNIKEFGVEGYRALKQDKAACFPLNKFCGALSLNHMTSYYFKATNTTIDNKDKIVVLGNMISNHE